MNSGLILPEHESDSLKKFESPKDRLGSMYEAAMQAIEDVGIRKHVTSLFQGSGFIYETTDLSRQGHGLVVATTGQTRYIVRFDGQYDNTSPYVTLEIDDPSRDATASIPLVPTHPMIEGRVRGWTKRAFEFGSNYVSISDTEKQQLITGFTASKLDAPQTKKQVVTDLWKANNDREIGMPKHNIGDVLMMGRGWGRFFDTKHMMINPSEPPSDVVYDFQQPEESENILDVPRNNEWRDVVQRSFLHQRAYLARSLTQLEGMTGHQVMDLNNGGEFRYLPTKRGLALVRQLGQSIPLVIENIPENELTNIFESVLNKDQPDWHIVDSELWNGLKDGTQQDLSCVNTEETTDSKDEIDIEYAERITQARRFRFISQVVAQKMRYGIKWLFVRKQSAALQELARLEQLPTERIIQRYNL